MFQACIFHIDNLELAILSGSPGSFSGELVIRNYNLKKKKKKLQSEDRGAYYCSLLFVDLPIGWNWYMCVCVCVCARARARAHMHLRLKHVCLEIKTEWQFQFRFRTMGLLTLMLCLLYLFNYFFSERLVCFRASLVTQMVKNLLAMQETWVWSLLKKFPWRREWLPTQVFLPGEFYGQRSLAGD